MTYTWHFYTTGQVINPLGRRCHRGPMIDVEVIMSSKFTYAIEFEILRAKLLDKIVNTDLKAVQTREVVLRSINQILGPIFARLEPIKQELQVLICEKRRSTDIEADLSYLNTDFVSSVNTFSKYGVQSQHLALITAALESNSPIVRVAGKCAVILLASFIELDYLNA